MVQNSDWLDSIKFKVKKKPRLYKFLIEVISPVFYFKKSSYQKIFRYLDPKENIIVNIGSGPFRLHDNIINIDISDYTNVDLIANAKKLPLKNESVDGIINVVSLEHINNPELVMDEFYRLLKPGGYIYTALPFIAGYHASPHDYKRWTISGIKNLHNKFSEQEVNVFGGPTSGLVWILTEWLALLLSFRILPLYKALFILFTLILWPLKFLDILLINHPMSNNIASSFYYIGMKKT
ncbi:methyltransferase domain-containing protein [Methanoplanus limicola]|uniref:Methyltransferase type 11 n=1 Tax=Methanoplanus limicola DSM 2279 TaxID=937775 RepID=H1Z1X8_9EURY|nr:class I SAM-dependent methyltransferase [Methanoplanus limicola]EHQ35445.1 Methyltransferase type 11 [Methanoplanus limicola DSM 2279]